MTRREKLYAPAAQVASTVLAGGAILSGVVFLYMIYLSTRGKHFTTLVAVFLYVFPAALAAVCLACFQAASFLQDQCRPFSFIDSYFHFCCRDHSD